MSCSLLIISAGDEGAGEMHAPRETRRTRDARGAPKIFDSPFSSRVLRVSRGACISPAPSSLAEIIRDYLQSSRLLVIVFACFFVCFY